MKIKYYEWTCAGCGKISRFTNTGTSLGIPYWFTLRTENPVSSSERPNFNTTICSTACFEKAGAHIDESIKSHSYSIPRKKEIEATICDHYGEFKKIDALNMLCGPNPLQDWIWEKSSEDRKDFCCTECKKNHTAHPEDSVFAECKLNQFFGIYPLIDALNSPDFKEALKILVHAKRICFKQS